MAPKNGCKSEANCVRHLVPQLPPGRRIPQRMEKTAITSRATNGHDAISLIRKWLTAAKLELVLLSKRRSRKEFVITVGEHTISSQPYLKFLGVIIDPSITIKDHCEAVNKKLQLVHSALSRLMPNIGGSWEEKPKLPSIFTTTVITYAAPIWAIAKKSRMKGLRTTHRVSALRVASAYRTVL